MMRALLLSVVAGVVAAGCPEGQVEVGKLSDGGLVCEQLNVLNGTFTIVGGGSDGLTLGKRVYSQNTPGDWGGLNKTDVVSTGKDLLAALFLKNGKDPEFERVLGAVPPLVFGWGANGGQQYAGQHTFVSSRSSDVEAVFDRFGDVGVWAGYPRPPVVIGSEWSKAQLNVYEGLVGGSLMVVQYTYAINATARWEMTVVPVDTDGNREQTVMFRFMRIQDGQPGKTLIFDTYAYNPAFTPTTTDFYDALVAHRNYWTNLWSQEGRSQMTIPETTLYDQAVHSLARDMVTRRATWWPKYGVCGTPGGCSYGGPHNNGFQEIFTASVMSSIEWGNLAYAKGVVDNYLTNYVRRGGGIHYRGLEMAQQGRMLTAIALYFRYSNDDQMIRGHQDKLVGLASLLERRVNASRQLPRDSPAYGMPTGNDEADSFVDESSSYPKGTGLPFYSIATETVRGFLELGQVFVDLQVQAQYGRQLLASAATLKADLAISLQRTVNGTCHPYVAGASTCNQLSPDVSPYFRNSEPFRTYSEMFYSAVLPKNVTDAIIRYNLNNEFLTRMAFPAGGSSAKDCCNLQTFTSHGWGYGLLQNDNVPEFLLQLFAVSSHAYTRGTWTAAEEATLQEQFSMPYCPPSQVTTPLNLKWMMLIDDPNTKTVWYGKAIPRAWFAPGSKPIELKHGMSRWGATSYTYTPALVSTGGGQVTFTAQLNDAPSFRIRLRLPAPFVVRSVSVNGSSHSYDSASESISLEGSFARQAVTVVFTLD